MNTEIKGFVTGNDMVLTASQTYPSGVRQDFAGPVYGVSEADLGCLDAPQEVAAGSHRCTSWGVRMSSFSLRPWW